MLSNGCILNISTSNMASTLRLGPQSREASPSSLRRQVWCLVWPQRLCPGRWLTVPLAFQPLELLCEKSIGTANRPMGAGEALRRVLECLASGIVMPGGALCAASHRHRTGIEAPRPLPGGSPDRVRAAATPCPPRAEACDYPLAPSYPALCRLRSVTQGGPGAVVAHSHASSLL